MNIFPAIDLFEGNAVRLFKGDYSRMTVYSDNPLQIARDFEQKGARLIHMVDLEGAKNGTTPNIEVVKQIAQNTELFTEIGGGIRSAETIMVPLRVMRKSACRLWQDEVSRQWRP